MALVEATDLRETTRDTVRSADGTKIAFDKVGDGPALILVDGAMTTRSSGSKTELAKLLAQHFTVYNHFVNTRQTAIHLGHELRVRGAAGVAIDDGQFHELSNVPNRHQVDRVFAPPEDGRCPALKAIRAEPDPRKYLSRLRGRILGRRWT